MYKTKHIFLALGLATVLTGCTHPKEQSPKDSEVPKPEISEVQKPETSEVQKPEVQQQLTDEDKVFLKPEEKLATVADTDILVMDWNAEFSALPEQTQQQGEDALFAPLLDTLIQKQAIVDIAISEGLEDSEEYKSFMRKAKRDLLSQLYIDQKVGAVLAKTDLKAEYEKLKSEWEGQQEIDTSHILVKSRKDAEEIIVALENGADFKALAKSKSTGPSGPTGGSLGWVSVGQTLPEFEQVLFALKDGSISEKPVKTQFGWHVIQRGKSRDKEIPTFEVLEPQIRESVIDSALNSLVSGVIAKTKIKTYRPEQADKK